MGESRRTYLQWLEKNNQSGRGGDDAGPFTVRRFLLENGKRLDKRSVVYEIGDSVGARIIRDCAYDPTTRYVWYLAECTKCGFQHWNKSSTLVFKVASDSCIHCCERLPKETSRQFMRKHEDPAIGAVFGELTVLGNERKVYTTDKGVRRSDYYSLVQCSCGVEPYWVLQSNLRLGRTTRCPKCASKKSRSTQDKNYWNYASLVPDAATRRRLLQRISACFQRCKAKRPPSCFGWEHYGGRGIRVEFPDRRSFLEYLITLPGYDDPSLELDRIDCDGNYAPGNLRFISRKENLHNKRSIASLQSRIDSIKRNKPLIEWCLNAVRYQLSKGVRPEELWPEQPFPYQTGDDNADGA